MGTGIHGFIECRWDRRLDEGGRTWFQAIGLSHLCNGRDYVAFGSLFDVRDTTSFRPFADHRGLPHDVSKEVLADFEPWSDELHGESWIASAELTAVDWDEVANAALRIRPGAISDEQSIAANTAHSGRTNG